MKYKIEAKKFEENFGFYTKVREKGLGRFFVSKEDRRIYRNNARSLTDGFENVCYNPLEKTVEVSLRDLRDFC